MKKAEGGVSKPRSGRTGTRIAFWATAALATGQPVAAFAHVKWFTAYDVAAAPTPIAAIFTPLFLLALFASTFAIASLAGIDRFIEQCGLARRLDALLEPWKARSPDILRIGLGVFFVCLWMIGNVFITPELLTTLDWVPWLQLFLAVCTLSWRTTFITGFGLIGLYIAATWNYGIFHMLDYPLFLGIAAFLIIHSLDITRLKPYANSILCLSVVQTLLWASVEKWAYSFWTLPLLERHQRITLGIDHRVYVLLAGFVEFVATFLILVGDTSQRLAALVLLMIFGAAIMDFGKIDAVGHLMIMASFAVIIINGNTGLNRLFQNRQSSLAVGTVEASVVFLSCFFLYVFSYYILHALFFAKLRF